MDTLAAFAMGLANQNKDRMVFDWDRAAKIIREKRPERADAGLSGDLEYTCDTIYRDGRPVPSEQSSPYLASTWATPVLIIDWEEIECFRMEPELPGWDEKTYWPASALAMLDEPEAA